MSNDAFQIESVKLDGSSSSNKGFLLVVNGLEKEECRNLISEMGNQWDYVETISGANAGKNATVTTKSLSEAVSGTILKSLISGEISASAIVADSVCVDSGATNGVVFGSK